MRQEFWKTVCVLNLLASGVGAQTLTGRAVNAAAAPLTGVKVTLTPNNISDTTGSDGLFSLTVPSAILPGQENGQTPAFAIRNNQIELSLDAPQQISIAVYAITGKKLATLVDQFLGRGAHNISLNGWMQGSGSGLYILGATVNRAATYSKIVVSGGNAHAASQNDFTSTTPLFKNAATADTISFLKSGYFSKQLAISSLTTQNLGDVLINQDKIFVNKTNYDQYDQFIVTSVAQYGPDSSVAMVLKAMMVIESGFNAQAISMYDTQLPCGTHSYGLVQVTPGCEQGFATLPAGTPVTATISGGLNGMAATLAYNNPADKTAGNTVVMESGIIIDLVTNPANALYPTSAFNPAYAIDNGAKAIANVISQMKSKYSNCTAANYVSMGLAGYNQGAGTVTGCTTYSANGQSYANSVLTQYRTFCQQAGVTPLY